MHLRLYCSSVPVFGNVLKSHEKVVILFISYSLSRFCACYVSNNVAEEVKSKLKRGTKSSE